MFTKPNLNFYKWLGYLTLFLFGCSSSEISVDGLAKRAAFIAAKPMLEKVFNAETPVAPSNRELYPTVESLPGKAFDSRKHFQNRLRFLAGTVLATPGDYIIPVMTYCLKSSGSSPRAHRYTLGKLTGRLAFVVRDLNALALLRFDPRDIQVVYWSIQNGVPIEEMAVKSRKIVDEVIPQHRPELEKSFFQGFVEKWDEISDTTGIPRFDKATDSALESLGDLGRAIRATKDFRKKLKTGVGDYDTLKTLVALSGPSETPGTESTTPWSKLSENVYARFVTGGHYLEVGELEVRILAAARSVQSRKNNLTTIDIGSLVADPGTGNIQPLSFSALSGMLAVGTLPAEVSPALAASVIAAILAQQYVDWDAFAKAAEKFGSSVRDLIQKGIHTLSKEHDALEKPLRDAGILNENSQDISTSPTGARNYAKPGGKEAAEKDFDKLPGKEEPTSKPGVRLKYLPDGKKAVFRTDEDPPTIEMQPNDAGRGSDRTRVKVRYR